MSGKLYSMCPFAYGFAYYSLKITPALFIHVMVVSVACPLSSCVVFHCMNRHNVFILFPLDCFFQFRTVLYKAARTFRYVSSGGHMPSYLLGSHPEVNLLDYRHCVSLLPDCFPK